MNRVNIGGVNWNNVNKHARNPKDMKEQAYVNKCLLDYISMLQAQVDEIKKILDDDGR